MTKCFNCDKEATWFYAPGKEEDVACDDCVPRGCSCNLELKSGVKEIPYHEGINDAEDYYQPVDDLGREFPCIEWMRFDEKFEEVNI